MLAFRSLAIIGLLTLTVGCGQASAVKMVRVTGTVKYKGEPVKDAVVTFATEKSPRTAVGMTDAQGKYSLTTLKTNDGAVAGDHTITIFKSPPAGSTNPIPSTPDVNGKAMAGDDYLKAMAGSKTGKPPSADVVGKELPAKYSNPATSLLKRTVVAGEANDFGFDLTD